MPVNVLLIGRQTIESVPIFDCVQRVSANVRHAHQMPVGSLADADWFPHLVVVLQHWSDEWEPQSINGLLAEFPLARWVCCYGAWCESDGRNRPTHWPTGIRVPMRRSVSRIHRELAVLDGQADPLPLTASREELFAFDFQPVLHSRTTYGRAAVSSPDRAYRATLESLLECWGMAIVSADQTSPDVVLCDIDPWSHRQLEVQRLQARHSKTQLIGIATMPTADLIAAATEAGCSRVVSKFSSLADIDWTSADPIVRMQVRDAARDVVLQQRVTLSQPRVARAE